MKTVFVLTSRYQICSEKATGSYHSLISGLKLNGVKIKTTGVCRLLGDLDETVKKDDIISAGKEADLIILFFVCVPQTYTSEDILQEPYLSKAFMIDRWDKTVFIDYYEYTWRNVYDISEPDYHRVLIKKCKKYFKRELTRWHLACFENILPYPLSYFRPSLMSLPEKKHDIFCSFPQALTGLRRQVIELCRSLQGEFNIVIKDDCTQEEYFNFIRSSWITLDAKGAGYINNRFLEIISNRSLCAREKYEVVFYEDYDENMIVEYSGIPDLEGKLKDLLNNKGRIEEMESKAYEHYNLHHTSDKVVEYLLAESLKGA